VGAWAVGQGYAGSCAACGAHLCVFALQALLASVRRPRSAGQRSPGMVLNPLPPWCSAVPVREASRRTSWPPSLSWLVRVAGQPCRKHFWHWRLSSLAWHPLRWCHPLLAASSCHTQLSSSHDGHRLMHRHPLPMAGMVCYAVLCRPLLTVSMASSGVATPRSRCPLLVASTTFWRCLASAPAALCSWRARLRSSIDGCHLHVSGARWAAALYPWRAWSFCVAGQAVVVWRDACLLQPRGCVAQSLRSARQMVCR